MFLIFLFFSVLFAVFYSGLYVLLLTCLISKEREREGVGLEGWRCGEDLGEVKEEKPRSEYTV